MDESLGMQMAHCAHDGEQQAYRLFGRKLFIAYDVTEVRPLDVFHGEIVLAMDLARFINLNDVGVLDAGRRTRLGVKAQHMRRRSQAAAEDHLDGNQPVEVLLPCLVDHPHAASAQFAQQLVLPKIRKGAR